MIGRRDFFFVPALLFTVLTPLILPSSSVPLSYFILVVPMRSAWENTRSRVSHFLRPYWTALLLFVGRNSPCCGRSFPYQNLIKLTYFVPFLLTVFTLCVPSPTYSLSNCTLAVKLKYIIIIIIIRIRKTISNLIKHQ